MTINTLEFAQLADAAYVDNLASFRTDNPVRSAFEQRLSIAEVDRIDKVYSDILSFNGPAGLSMTLFIREGKTILAFRGTQDAKDVFADLLISTGVGASLNPQYIAAKAQIDKWIADGVIQGDFSVTGHSLGGYLAAAIKESYPTKVTEAYVFNAPALEVSLGL